MKDKISVIIPAHNEEKYILGVIESLKKNTTPFELIVVCDSCIDNTRDVASRYTDLVFDVDFHNVSKTRNLGVEKSSGDILVFLDADTIVSENYLEEISKVVFKFDYGCAKWFSESETILGKYIAWATNNYNKKGDIGGNFFVKKELFNKVGGFNVNMKRGEDTDLGERLKNVGAMHCFLRSCFIVPSERRYKESGYIYMLLKTGISGFVYKFFRKYYNKTIASKFYE